MQWQHIRSLTATARNLVSRAAAPSHEWEDSSSSCNKCICMRGGEHSSSCNKCICYEVRGGCVKFVFKTASHCVFGKQSNMRKQAIACVNTRKRKEKFCAATSHERTMEEESTT